MLVVMGPPLVSLDDLFAKWMAEFSLVQSSMGPMNQLFDRKVAMILSRGGLSFDLYSLVWRDKHKNKHLGGLPHG